MSSFVKASGNITPNSADPGEEFPFLHTITVVDRVVSVDKPELVQNNIKTETTMIETIGTANSYQNLAARTYLKVCPGEDVTLSVTNTGTEPVTVDANAAFTSRRIA